MQKMIAFFARALVRDPQQVRVEESTSGRQTVYTLHVAPEDMGRIIGRNGRTIMALRTVIAALAVRDRQKVILKIEEE